MSSQGKNFQDPSLWDASPWECYQYDKVNSIDYVKKFMKFASDIGRLHQTNIRTENGAMMRMEDNNGERAR